MFFSIYHVYDICFAVYIIHVLYDLHQNWILMNINNQYHYKYMVYIYVYMYIYVYIIYIYTQQGGDPQL